MGHLRQQRLGCAAPALAVRLEHLREKGSLSFASLAASFSDFDWHLDVPKAPCLPYPNWGGVCCLPVTCWMSGLRIRILRSSRWLGLVMRNPPYNLAAYNVEASFPSGYRIIRPRASADVRKPPPAQCLKRFCTMEAARSCKVHATPSLTLRIHECLFVCHTLSCLSLCVCRECCRSNKLCKAFL